LPGSSDLAGDAVFVSGPAQATPTAQKTSSRKRFSTVLIA